MQDGVMMEPMLAPLKAALVLVCRGRPFPPAATASTIGRWSVVLADYVDTLRLSSPLLPVMFFSMWAIIHWLAHTVQQALVSEDLVLLARIVFEHVPSTVGTSQMLMGELGLAGVGTVQLPVHCPQYWVLRSSTDQYTNVHLCHQWLQVQ